ncbi:hypothetical protein [Rubrivirga marina]|uniref:Uncharacterized protein n=1 Tax=Rubrivirga marina TaxID=1196024 RepID=A0A271J374_9BACT|nr:hypothetical protein [Rubrivirga marina]PAP77159.1 hypothetical protein BSZ37_12325 [Rubrivirga marina]
MAASELWKRIGWGLALVALVVAGDRALAAGLHAAVMSTGNRFAVLYRGEAPGGVLILGNSRALNTFHQPTLAGLLNVPVFNASYNGMSTELSEVVLYDYVDRNPDPELVVIEVTGVGADDDQVRDFFPFAAESERLRTYLSQTLPPRVATARRLLGLYNYNGEMLYRSLAAGASDQGTINRYKISPALVAAAERQEVAETRLRPENLAALGRMIAFCGERRIPVRLVVGPYLPAFRSKMTTYDAWVDAVSDGVGGVPIWDYSQAVTDVTAFADRVHLNYRGARLLAPRLFEDGLFDPAVAVPPAAVPPSPDVPVDP